MKKEILINAHAKENRIAITEDGKLAEFFIESPEQERNVGDIYLGKVGKVLPGIQAAFIDIGFTLDAFLHFSDVKHSLKEYSSIIGDDSDADDDDDDEGGNGTATAVQERSLTTVKLERNQSLIVQIIKEPVKKKGVRVTSKISLPGRYVVLMPYDRKIAVSKSIYNLREKRRLKKLVRDHLGGQFGAIIRTVAAGMDDNLIINDLNNLLASWKEISEKAATMTPPSLIYKDAGTTSSVIRDLFKDDVSKVIVDEKKLYREIKNYIDINTPEFSDKVELYPGSQPLFDAFNIEKQIEDSLNRKVWLRNGGHIIIESTEAMTVVDVNSGNFAKHKDPDQNALATNLEATKEIVRQVRLRDIGGLIVIDYIDMQDEKNRKKLFEEVRKEFRNDRAKVSILPVSDFGLIQITRQRIRQNIVHRVFDACPMCRGIGRVQSRTMFLTKLERWIQRYKGGNNKRKIILKLNPLMGSFISHGIFSTIRRLALKYFLRIKIVTDEKMSLDEFRVLTKDKDITAEYSG